MTTLLPSSIYATRWPQTQQVYVALCATRCLALQGGDGDLPVSSEQIAVRYRGCSGGRLYVVLSDRPFASW